jgi:phosphopantetheinyl transferase
MEQGTIHSLPRIVLGEYVVFASSVSMSEAKPGLARKLLRELTRHDSRWSAPADGEPLALHKSALGRPYLMLADKAGPSLSFSRGEWRLWAAMCGKGSVGIDIAYTEEFTGDYPFARAFRPEELDCVGALFPDHQARGLALIWSLKEASVKAIGSGFNLFDPLDVCVGKPNLREAGFLFEVLAGGSAIVAWARREGEGWLSLAWI